MQAETHGLETLGHPDKTREPEQTEPILRPASARIVQLCMPDETPLGSPIQLPEQISLQSLRELLPPGTPNAEVMRMFVCGTEICTTLAEALGGTTRIGDTGASESVLQVFCCPEEPPRKTRAPGYLASSCSGHKAAVLAVRISKCGTYACSASGDGTVRVWSCTTKSPVKIVTLQSHWIQCIEYSPDGNYLAAGAMNGGVSLLKCPDMSLVYTKKVHRDGVTCIAWRGDGAEFAAASRDASASVWNTSGHLRSVFHQQPVISVAWAGHRLLSAGRDCAIKVTDAKGEILQTLKGHTRWVTGMAVHAGRVAEKEGAAASAFPDNTFLVSAGDDRTSIIWRVREEKSGVHIFYPYRKLVGHTGVITNVSISPDGIHIATTSFDRTVRLWNAMSGTCAHVFRTHVSLTYQVIFSGGSNLLVSCSADRTVKIHSVQQRKLLADFVCRDQVFSIDMSGGTVVAGGKDKLVYFFI